MEILKMLDNIKKNIVQVWCHVPMLSTLIRQLQENYCKVEPTWIAYQIQTSHDCLCERLSENQRNKEQKKKKEKERNKFKEILIHNLLYQFAISQSFI